MNISLIGMSNVGKTYWAKKLEKKEFLRYSCDEYIANKLGHSGIEYVSEWLGQPYDSQYKGASKKYLEFEKESLREILMNLNKLNGQNMVIDTTGSVIYTGDKIMQSLNKLTKVIYLDIPDVIKHQMYSSYLENPKPVIWGDNFKKINSESNKEALARCYQILLDYRIKEYKKYAHVSLNYFLLRQKDFTSDNFLNLLLSIEDKT